MDALALGEHPGVQGIGERSGLCVAYFASLVRRLSRTSRSMVYS